MKGFHFPQSIGKTKKRIKHKQGCDLCYIEFWEAIFDDHSQKQSPPRSKISAMWKNLQVIRNTFQSFNERVTDEKTKLD